MQFNSPMSPETARHLVASLPLDPESRVLDVGCGTGGFLLQVVEAWNCRGLGLDIDQGSLKAARERAAENGFGESLEFEEVDIRNHEFDDSLFEAATCLGSSHAYSLGEAAFPEALKALQGLLRPGGLILMGEGHWTQDPAAEYLEFLGEPSGVYRSHDENGELGKSFGLELLESSASTLEEWDAFELGHYEKREKLALDNPDDRRTCPRPRLA